MLHSKGNKLHPPRLRSDDAGQLGAEGRREGRSRADRIIGFDGQIEREALRPAKGRACGALQLEPTSGELVFGGIWLPVLGARACRGQVGARDAGGPTALEVHWQQHLLHRPGLLPGQDDGEHPVAGVHDGTKAMPWAYIGLVSEVGNWLSGGQKQRKQDP